jgi:hypothetical protein
MLLVMGIFVAFLVLSIVVYFLFVQKGVLDQTTQGQKETTFGMDSRESGYKMSAEWRNAISASGYNSDGKEIFLKNGFVVIPSTYKEFYPIYESNRYDYTPNFITTDSLLHNFHLMFNYLLEKTEEKMLIVELKNLSSRMLSNALAQYESLKGGEWENAARRNVGFFAVGSKLIEPTTTIPSLVKSEVEKELGLIDAHKGIAEAPLMNIGSGKDVAMETPQGVLGLEALKEDYSQYVPRGHYTKSDQLEDYFKSMMWYGRMGFRLKNEDEIKSAVLITLALNEKSNQESWDKIYDPVNFFVGKSDDIAYPQFKELVTKIYGDNASVNNISSDDGKFSAFVKETASLDPPQINSIPIFNAAIQPDREKEIKGFRFMGQRFTIDASVFQRLMDREVAGRMLPKGMDIPAAFGSKEALVILEEMGETSYKGYSENMEKMQTYIGSLSEETWNQNLYWGWMYALKPLTEEKVEGYPDFMQNYAWARKELNTFLGSWTELKHDTILYAKQAYAELGGGPPEEKDDRGYVEPNPDVYSRLASLIRMTSEGLESRGLLESAMKDNLNKMEQLATSLKTISEKELNNQKLTDEEFELIRSYGGQIEHFWYEVNKEEINKTGINQMQYLDDNPAALVADVATDPNGEVLEEATGYISRIVVLVPVDGSFRIAEGGVYSYYEFTQPISDRLTDEAWRGMLSSEKAPALPDWTSAFTSN